MAEMLLFVCICDILTILCIFLNDQNSLHTDVPINLKETDSIDVFDMTGLEIIFTINVPFDVGLFHTNSL
jgi:hypothetical protein